MLFLFALTCAELREVQEINIRTHAHHDVPHVHELGPNQRFSMKIGDILVGVDLEHVYSAQLSKRS